MTKLLTCPQCGTANLADATNCKRCRIELKFALEHPEEIERIIRYKKRSGALVGLTLGLFMDVILWAIGADNLDLEPGLSTGAVLAGPVGVAICVIAGTVSGAVGAMIGGGRKSILSALGSPVGGAVGGAIGGVIGSLTLLGSGTLFSGGTTDFRLDGFVCGVGILSGTFTGAITGFVTGIIIGRLGVRIGGLITLAGSGFTFACSCFRFRPYSLAALILGLLIGLLISLSIEGISRVRGTVAGLAIAEAARIGGLGAAIGGLLGAIGAVFFTFSYFWI